MRIGIGALGSEHWHEIKVVVVVGLILISNIVIIYNNENHKCSSSQCPVPNAQSIHDDDEGGIGLG